MTHEELKQKAFKNKNVKKEYDKLDLEFQLLSEMLTTKKEARLNQSQDLNQLDIRSKHNQASV